MNKDNKPSCGALKVGFARVDITPPYGVKLYGYFIERIADGVLDPLEINCIALQDNGNLVLMMTVDNCGVALPYIELAKASIVKETNVDRDGIFIHSTHTHNAPKLSIDDETQGELDILYSKYVLHKFAQAAKAAINDLKSAQMGIAASKSENIGFNRRYLMKDGSVKTNPGVNNPDVVKSIGMIDEGVNVIRFKREDGLSIVLVNYGNHPDTVGGNKISGDWPALARCTFEKAVDNTKCIFFNGCQGDINHVNAMPQGGYMNGMKIDFDNVPRGYAHAKHLANVVAASAMQVYEKVEYTDNTELSYIQKNIEIPLNKPTPEEMPEARRIHELHTAGKDELLPYKGMMLTTMVADAARKVKLENAPDTQSALLSFIKIGKIAFVGIPGEPFAGVGIELKKTEGYDMILSCCNTNAYEGYFPMQDSYDEGGYEAVTSPFKSGCAELLIERSKDVLKNMHSYCMASVTLKKGQNKYE